MTSNYGLLIKEAIALLRMFSLRRQRLDDFIDDARIYLWAFSRPQKDLVIDIVAGCVEHKKFLDVVINEFYEQHGQNLLRSEHSQFDIVCYLAIFAIDDLGVECFSSIIYSMDLKKMFTFLSFFISNLNWIQDEWNIYDASLEEKQWIDPLLRWSPEINFLLDQIAEKISEESHLKKIPSKTTVPKEFNLAKPKPRWPPSPEVIPEIKTKQVPESTYLPPKETPKMEKFEQRNQQQAEKMDKLKELNMTTDEVSRLTDAFKDENFRNLLCDYAEEISDPENKRLYEEQLTLMEQEKGNSIEFIHPEPFKVIKTSVDGKQKCFINICSSEKVGKPESECGVGLDGDRGECWALPHSLHPGRPDTDGKGNKAVVYDVVFHPDTLCIASKNELFMDMVDRTAIEGIQKAFKVTLDKNKAKDLKMKYKGTPQACISRKLIPGYKAKESPEGLNHLSCLHPDENGSNHSSDPETEPTKPKHTVKYCSFIDMQDFTCARDSTKSYRPKEIVVTIDLPLLETISDTNLEVKDTSLKLESKKPAYKLELALAYTVDEDKGRAQFIKQRRQLIVTLPVCPPAHSALECFTGNELEKTVEEDRKDDEKKQETEMKIQDVKQEEMIQYEKTSTDGETTECKVHGKSLDNETTDYVAEFQVLP